MRCQTLFKPVLYCSLMVLILLSAQVHAQPPSSRIRGLYGDWQIKYQTGERQREAIISFSRDSEGYRTGQWISFMSLSELKDLKYEDGKLSFTRSSRDREGQTTTSKFTGTIQDGILSGTMSSDRGEYKVEGKPMPRIPRAVGSWEMKLKMGEREFTSKLIVNVDKEGKLTGQWQSQRGESKITDVQYEQGKLTFKRKSTYQGRERESTFEGTIERETDTLSGVIKSQRGEMTVEGKRIGAPLIGIWNLEVVSERGTREQRLRINPDMTALYGAIPIKKVTFEGNRVSFKIVLEFRDWTFGMGFEGKLADSKLTGELTNSRGSQKITGTKLVSTFRRRRAPMVGASDQIQNGEMAGYLIVPHGRVPETYNAGFSIYAAAWPLLDKYPGNRFQTGLFGTWMHAQYDVRPSEELGRLYSDIEGGLGWWRDTRFATETPKFIMGGVALNFVAWANGPGAGKGRDWDRPAGKYGVAQLTPWLIWPPDGLNLKQGTCGELFGYGYLPLPLIAAKSTTTGKNVPTGGNCWTLFLNTRNFKGPVTFFTPYFFSRPSVDNPRLSGLFLDSRPSGPNRAIQMETQYVPSVQATDKNGETYARVAPTSFPRDSQGHSVVLNRAICYNKKALWDAANAWFAGGAPASGTIDARESSAYSFSGGGRATWRISGPSTSREERVPIAWNSFATPVSPDPNTFGYRWDEQLVTKKDTKDGPLVTLPEYYRLAKGDNGRSEWIPVAPEDVPAETGLTKVRFDRDVSRSKPYVTPDDPDSCWKKPGPVAGPFQTRPGDGSVVTYYWYRFADQPALLNSDLTDQERKNLQKRVEKLHRNWTKDHDYLPSPTTGKLAEIDPALIVTPPAGLEIGYVPIVTRQAEAE